MDKNINKKEENGLLSFLKSNIIIIISTIIIVLAIGFKLLFTANLVSGSSMYPTLINNDKILVYKYGALNRQQVVTIHPPKMAIKKGEDKDIEYLKRLIGLPGDSVSWTNDVLRINNKVVDEPYLVDGKVIYFNSALERYDLQSKGKFVAEDSKLYFKDSNKNKTLADDKFMTKLFGDKYQPFTANFKTKLGNDEYLVSGDNRPISYDGRAFGAIHKDNFLGTQVASYPLWL